MVWAIIACGRINKYIGKFRRSVQLYKKYITVDSMECVCQNKLVAVVETSQKIDKYMKTIIFIIIPFEYF